MLASLVAARAASPTQALDALQASLGPDPFAASFALEYLHSTLPEPLRLPVTALFRAARPPTSFLAGAPAILGEDLAGLDLPRILDAAERLFPVTGAGRPEHPGGEANRDR